MNSLTNQHLQWVQGHTRAVTRPSVTEKPFVHIVQFLHDFRVSHALGSDLPLAEDNYSSEPWLEILKATRTLLSTELGRLDGHVLDAYILAELKAAGFTEDYL